MTDIVERLRTFDAWEKVIARCKLTKEAADEIDNQRREAADEIERLRAALRAIVAQSEKWSWHPEHGILRMMAREALDD